MLKNSKEATANTNHKNRKYSILLLALLFIGVATYGTYAYFTDSKNIDGQLTLTKGQVSLGDVVGSDWTYKGNTGEGDDYSQLQNNGQLKFTNKNISSRTSTTGTSFSNVLPGDTFKTTITVSYTGSVDATGIITLNTDKISNNIDYTVLFNNGEANQSLDAGGSKNVTFFADKEDTKKLTFTLIVHVPYYGTEDFNVKGSRNNGSTNTFLDNLTDAITVRVEQQLTSTTSSN